MPRRTPRHDNSPATKSDVESIMTRVVLTLVPPMVEGIVDGKLGTFFVEVDGKIEFLAMMVGRGLFKEDAEPVLYALQSDMADVKTRLGGVESGLSEVKNDLASFRRAIRSGWQDHESRIIHLEKTSPGRP